MVLKKKKDILSQSDDEVSISFDEDSDFDDEEQIDDLKFFDDVAAKDSEDSDSAPEEVCFRDEEEKNRLLKKRTSEHLKLQKEQIKKKRTEMHFRNMKQKEEKKKKTRELPSDILESLVESPRVEKSSTPAENAVCDNVTVQKPEFSKSDEIVGTYGPTVFMVKNMKKELEKPLPISNDASSFRNRMLYGQKNRREKSTNDYFAKLEKQKIRANR